MYFNFRDSIIDVCESSSFSSIDRCLLRVTNSQLSFFRGYIYRGVEVNGGTEKTTTIIQTKLLCAENLEMYTSLMVERNIKNADKLARAKRIYLPARSGSPLSISHTS
jgi:hypothetical protein